MRISPINLFNLNGCNCPPKRKEMNIFARNNAVDSVSFSGNSKACEPYHYNLEEREKPKIIGGNYKDNSRVEETLTELDTRTNEVVKKANEVNHRAERSRLAIMSALNGGKFSSSFVKNDGSYDIAIDLTGNQTLFAHVNNDYTIDTIYSHSISDNRSASESEKYTFDRETQKLSEYLETDDSSSLTLQFDKDKIEGERIPKGSKKYKKEKFYIGYNYLGEIATSRFENPFYNGTNNTRSIQKTAVGEEHSNNVGYALTEIIENPYDSRDDKKIFLQWVSYD